MSGRALPPPTASSPPPTASSSPRARRLDAGFLVVDKPAGVTSHDVVEAVRRVTGVARAGHTGTLDPFATGVLPVALGRATKAIRFLDEGVKRYEAVLSLGRATDTGDLDGRTTRVAPPPDAETMRPERVDAALSALIGRRMQSPPAYSARRVDGKRLYEYAREGAAPPRPAEARPVEVRALERLTAAPDAGGKGAVAGNPRNPRNPRTAEDGGEDGGAPPAAVLLRFRVDCSRGTYVRVLGEEIAQALGTVGHLTALRRLRSGPFTLDDAVDLGALALAARGTEDWRGPLGRTSDPAAGRPRAGPRRRRRPPPLDAAAEAAVSERTLSPSRALAHLPSVSVDGRAAARIARGGPPPPAPESVDAGGTFLVRRGDEALTIAEARGGRRPGKALVRLAVH